MAAVAAVAAVAVMAGPRRKEGGVVEAGAIMKRQEMRTTSTQMSRSGEPGAPSALGTVVVAKAKRRGQQATAAPSPLQLRQQVAAPQP